MIVLKTERRKAFPPDDYPMENQTPNRPPQRKKVPLRDLILILLAVLVLFRVDWGNMNSFHYLILFLLILCFMLRWSNMRKEAQRRELMERRRQAEEAQMQSQPTETEIIAAEDITVDGEAIPPQEEKAPQNTEE